MKNFGIYSHLFVFLLFITNAKAQENKKAIKLKPFITGDYTARYFNLQSEKNKFDVDKVQGALTLDIGINVGKKITTHGVLVQTPALGKRYYTIYDFNKKADSPSLFDQEGATILPSTLFIQKLYAQYEDEKTKIQIGTIPRAQFTNKFKSEQKTKTSTIENGFMGSNAWVDGARISYNTAKGKRPGLLLTLTVGALDELSTSYAQRSIRKPNYAEAQIDFGNCKGRIIEGSVGIVDEDLFIRTGIEDFIKVTNDVTVKLYSESLYNVSEQEIASILGFQTDILKAMNPKLNDKVNLGVEIAYIDPKIGVRGTMANDAFLPGKRFRIQLSGKLDEKGNLTWFAQRDIGTNQIWNVGTKVSFKK